RSERDSVRRRWGPTAPARRDLGPSLTQSSYVLRFAEVRDLSHQLLRTAHSVHRRAEPGEQIHQRLDQPARAAHHDDLGPVLVLLDRANYRLRDLLPTHHER